MEEGKKEKSFYKKWWFWVIVIIVCVLLCIITVSYLKNKETEKVQSKIGEGASDYISGIDNAQSHIDEFSYNYETGEVEYKPSKITLEIYNRIKEGTTQEEVISILGKHEKKSEGENTYMLEWGNSYAPINNGYWIQIVFDTNKKVLSKYQTGLE